MLLQRMVVNFEKIPEVLSKILFNGGFVIDFVVNAWVGLWEWEEWTRQR